MNFHVAKLITFITESITQFLLIVTSFTLMPIYTIKLTNNDSLQKVFDWNKTK